MAMRLCVENLCFSYQSRPVLADVMLNIEPGQVVGLVGPNGAGKTTLIKCIDRILRPSHGQVLVGNEDVERISPKDLARQIGYVPQSVSSHFPFSVYETVLLGRRPHIERRVGEKDHEAVCRILQTLCITEMAHRSLTGLSGGERQKVIIARALAQEAPIMLLDEPTSNLDLRHQLEVMDLLRSLASSEGISMIMAIHDLNLAARYCHQLVFMKNGAIYDAGPPESSLNTENIAEVYGVNSCVRSEPEGLYVVPLSVHRGENRASA